LRGPKQFLLIVLFRSDKQLQVANTNGDRSVELEGPADATSIFITSRREPKIISHLDFLAERKGYAVLSVRAAFAAASMPNA
jgi:hypothetical protein